MICICDVSCKPLNMVRLIRVVLHSFSLSKVSYEGEFYPERFLMRQHYTQLSYPFNFLLFSVCLFWFWFEAFLKKIL
jgi:hypothetical protein